MFVLMATREEVAQKYIGGHFESTFEDEQVATFDDREVAEQYIEDSKLKQRQYVSYGADRVFKSKSLLSLYVSAWVEEYVEEVLEHNPSL